MKRLLRCLCLCALCPLVVTGCGDDEGGGGSEDGGMTTIDDLSDQVDNLEGQLTGVSDDVEGLGEDLNGLEGQVGDLEQSLDDLRNDVENPDILDCSESELCVPDGVMFSQAALEDLVTVVCEHEINCCDEDELNFKFGPGIASVEDCVQLFTDLVNNGQSPWFLQDNPYVINQIIAVAQAINDEATHIELNADGIADCVEQLDSRECPEYTEVEPDTECVNPEPVEEDVCAIANLVTGLQAEGELCGDYYGVPECADGLFCSHESSSQRGICAPLPSEGDLCREDNDCDPGFDEWNWGNFMTNLFCNKKTSACEPLGDVGDPCEYVDPTFSYYDYYLNPWQYQKEATAVGCLPHLICDPIAEECAEHCDAGGQFCQRGEVTTPCPEGLICNVSALPDLFDNYGGGVCTVEIDDGERATYADECASGRLDVDDDLNDICGEQLKDAGDDCDAAGEDAECEFGWCDTDEHCSARCNCEGEDCDNFFEEGDWVATPCDDGFYCDWGNPRGGSWYACEPKVDNNEVCDTTNNSPHTSCTSGFCDPDQGDDEAGTANLCSPKQTAAQNAPCTTTNDEECPNGQYCNSMNLCRPYVAEGGSCEVVDPLVECHPDLICVTSTGTDTCAEPAALGEACNDGNMEDPSCAFGLSCIDTDGAAGTEMGCYDYTGTFANGVDCTTWGAGGGIYCASGWCQPNSPTAPTSWACAPKIEVGEACDADDATLNVCEDGTFCNHGVDDSEGECAEQHLPGQSCKPYLGGMDCLNSTGSGDCVLTNDQFVCNQYAQPPESLFCDGA